MLTFPSLFSLAVALTGPSAPAGHPAPIALLEETDVVDARSTAITTVDLPHAPVLSAAPAPPPSARRHFHFGAATLQMGTLVGLGVGWYEWQIEVNKLDFARTFEGQLHRLTTTAGYRFDDNERYLNIGHAGMGALYYQTARAHGAGMGAAYLFNIGTSTLWELAVEHREVVSVNDQLVTGLGGAPLGEALYRISEVFARRKPTVFNRVMMAVVCPMRLGAWLGGESPSASHEASNDDSDALSPDSPASHRFALSLGGLAGVNDITGAPLAGAPTAAPGDDAWTSSARGDFEVMALPGYSDAEAADDLAETEGSSSTRLRGGELTRLTVQYAGGANRFRDFDLVARTTLFGRFDRSVSRRPDGLHQSSRVLGAASAFELAYDRAGGVTDFMSLVHVLGPTADMRWAHDGFSVRGEISGYGDFALVRPLAIGADGATTSLEGTKSTLAGHEYYYGWGGTAAARLEVGYGRLRGGTAAEWNHIDSIEGLDRHQEAYVSPVGAAHAAIADDSNLTDDRLKLRLFVDVPVPFVKRASLGAAADLIHRQGDWQARNLAATQQDRRVALSLTYTL